MATLEQAFLDAYSDTSVEVLYQAATVGRDYPDYGIHPMGGGADPLFESYTLEAGNMADALTEGTDHLSGLGLVQVAAWKSPVDNANQAYSVWAKLPS